MDGIDLSGLEFEGFNDLEKLLGRLAFTQILGSATSNKIGFLKRFEEKIYYDVANALGISKERAEEIRSIVYIRNTGYFDSPQ